MFIKKKGKFLEWLEERRIAQNLSLRDLCRDTSFTAQTWNRYVLKQREVSWDNLFEAAEILGYSYSIEIKKK